MSERDQQYFPFLTRDGDDDARELPHIVESHSDAIATESTPIFESENPSFESTDQFQETGFSSPGAFPSQEGSGDGPSDVSQTDVNMEDTPTSSVHPSASTPAFECNICLETATEPVVTLCGHLYCWPCLHLWIESRQQHGGANCPVCKAGISQDKVIPVYARGGTSSDPRLKIPSRPIGQRPQPVPTINTTSNTASNFGFGTTFHYGGAHVTFGSGMGLLPSLFGVQFQFPGADQNGLQNPPSRETVEEYKAVVSRLFLCFGLLIMAGLLLF